MVVGYHGYEIQHDNSEHVYSVHPPPFCQALNFICAQLTCPFPGVSLVQGQTINAIFRKAKLLLKGASRLWKPVEGSRDGSGWSLASVCG